MITTRPLVRSVAAAACMVVLLSACAVEPMAPPPPRVAAAATVGGVVSVVVDAPLFQPDPVEVGWAPPPMLVDAPPPMPFAGAVWTGGYWTWQGDWVWAAGRWSAPPHPGYGWVQPYYEHRDSGVVFIDGFWSAPGVAFVAPSLSMQISAVSAGPGVMPGPRPIGPVGVFVPPPPGSRPGLIVPAPLGTAPAVVMSAPPVMNVGMRVQASFNESRSTVSNTSNVTVVAPAAAMASGRPYEANVPAQAHLAAALPPASHQMAPRPASARPVPAYASGRAPAALPPARGTREVRDEREVRGQADAPVARPAFPERAERERAAAVPDKARAAEEKEGERDARLRKEREERERRERGER